MLLVRILQRVLGVSILAGIALILYYELIVKARTLTTPANKSPNADDIMDEMPISSKRDSIFSASTGKELANMSSSMKEKIYGLMNTKPIRFLPNFKNPCWYGSRNNGPINDNKLHCVKKSGTTDLYNRIFLHPDYAKGGHKESQWFPGRRFNISVFPLRKEQAEALKGKDPRGLDYYVSMFDLAAKRIKEHPTTIHASTTYYNHVTCDATPGNLHLNRYWEMLPGNEGLVEPRYTTLHYIKHLVPDAKILIIFRDPVDRLYSDYLFQAHFSEEAASQLSQENLHEVMKADVELYQKCYSQYSMRRCIYNDSLEEKSGFTFHPSFYAFYMKELLNVFRRDQILPVLLSDYIQDKHATMANVFDFLRLSKLDSKTMNDVLTAGVKNENSKIKIKCGPMLEKTEQLLRTFFRPFNEEMAELMNDSRYLFQPPVL